MNQEAYTVVPIVSQPFQENTYVAWINNRSDCLVIDPGLQPDLILSYLQDQDLDVAMILNTHGHADHIGGNQVVTKAFPNAPLLIGNLDAPMLTNSILNLSDAFNVSLDSPPADRMVNEGDVVEAAGFRLDVLHIPGHSPGHIVFVWKDPAPVVVFGGDVLFAGSIGRTDLPGGDHHRLIDGIRSKLFKLPDDTHVYPGHGPQTTIAEERQFNPFVGDRVT